MDSLTRRKDDLRSMLWISPRKPGSNWSRVNKGLVAELETAGQMTAGGRAVIDRAKADGTWTALDDVENGVVPPDLEAALEILLNAKRAETRTRKIGDIVDAAQAGKRPFQWSPNTR